VGAGGSAAAGSPLAQVLFFVEADAGAHDAGAAEVAEERILRHEALNQARECQRSFAHASTR